MGFIMHRSIGVTLFLIASVLVPRQARAFDPVAITLNTATIIGGVAGGLDLIDRVKAWNSLATSNGAKLDQLIDQNLRTAQNSMLQYANTPKNRKYLEDARENFNLAAGVYKGGHDGGTKYKRAMALLGMKLCFDASNDRANAQWALLEITKIGMISESASVEKGPNYPKYLAILDEVYSHLITEGAITRDSIFKKANRLYRGEGGSPQEFEAAFRLMRVAAKQGHREAQAILGDMYLVGRGVRRDYVEGAAWAAVSSMNGPGNYNFTISNVTLSSDDKVKFRKRVLELFKKYGKTK